MYSLSLTAIGASYAEYNIIESDDARSYTVLGTFSTRTITACTMQCRNHRFCTHSSVEDNGDKKTCSLMVGKESDEEDAIPSKKVIMTEVISLVNMLV